MALLKRYTGSPRLNEKSSRGAVWCSRVLYGRRSEGHTDTMLARAPTFEQPQERRGSGRRPAPMAMRAGPTVETRAMPEEPRTSSERWGHR